MSSRPFDLFPAEETHILTVEDAVLDNEGAAQRIKHTTATYLQLRNCQLMAPLHSPSFSPLQSALSTNSSLTSLELTGCRPTSSLLPHIATALCLNKSITQLGISAALSDTEAAILASKMLSQSSHLQVLNLFRNRLSNDGTKELVRGLQTHSLSSLTLASNHIGLEGARSIAEFLTRNTSLVELNLSWNYIGAEGALALSSAVTINSSLRILELGANKLGDEGARHMSAAIAQNSSLHLVDLSLNSITQEGVSLVRDALYLNPSIETMYLRDLLISQPALQEIKFLSSRNSHNMSLRSVSLFNMLLFI